MDKRSFSQFWLYAFFIVSIVNLLNQIVKIEWINMTTKPLLLVTLLVYYLSSRMESPNKLALLIAGALGFSWIGDVLLMLQGQMEVLFMAGLLAFLLAHLLYILAYWQAIKQSNDHSYGAFVHLRIIFLIFVGGALVYMLYPSLGSLRLPVIVYTTVIIFMGISALMRRGRTSEKSFVLVYSGALLFIMSDAMLAINKFLYPLVQADLLIMASYISAQYLIIKGILIHENRLEVN